MNDRRWDALRELLGQAAREGLLGRSSPHAQIEHAVGFADTIHEPPQGEAADLGSGAGLPGLALALWWEQSRWSLIDGRTRACDFMRAGTARLGIAGRVTVVEARAEVLGHQAGFRGTFELVVARGFGPPSVTAECAAPLLKPGGSLVVSEPPTENRRWDGAEILGLEPTAWEDHRGGHYQRLAQRCPCPERYPRRHPGKRPLF